MHTYLLALWSKLHASFWFIPALCSVAATLLAGVLAYMDTRIKIDDDGMWGWVAASDAQTVKDLLTTTLSAVITVTSIVFSITVVALSLAASQFGPRVPRAFMQDRAVQTVLGVMVGTIVYCIVLLQLMGHLISLSLPNLSAMGAFIFALASVAALVFFIHHMARTIQAPAVIEHISHEVRGTLDRVWPDGDERAVGEPEPADDDAPPDPEADALLQLDPYPIRAHDTGYVQTINYPGLIDVAQRNDALIDVCVRPGTFVHEDTLLLRAHSRGGLNPQFVKKARAELVVGTTRTETQDPLYGTLQLAEVAARALSPGINDPRTAIACLDRLGAMLTLCVDRPSPDRRCRDEDGRVRVLRSPLAFHELVSAAFDMIRHNARNSPDVQVRLLSTLSDLARRCDDDDRRRPLRAQAMATARAARAADYDIRDRRRVERAYRDFRQALRGNGEGQTGIAAAGA